MGTLFYVPNTMAIKVLINELGQHLIADVSQVTNKETEELIAYWVKNPRLVSYAPGENEETTISLIDPCPISSDSEYAIAAHHIVSILEPAADIARGYSERVAPNEEPAGPQTETIQHEKPAAEPGEDGLLPKPERPAS